MSALLEARPGDWAPLVAGADYGEAYLEESSGASVHVEDSRVEEIAAGSDRGAGLRFLRKIPAAGGAPPTVETLFASQSSLEPSAAAALRRSLLDGAAVPAGPSGRLERVIHPVSESPSAAPLERKTRLLLDADHEVRSRFADVRQVSLTYGERLKTVAVFNSDGEARLERREVVLFVASVTAERGGILQTGTEVVGGLKGLELFADFDPLRVARAAAARAEAKLAAPQAPAGEMAVVLSSSAGGTFVHEAIGHSLEADHVQEGTSPAYHGKKGKAVAPEFLSIIDDPTLPFCRGSYAFDDEGTAAAATFVVRDGVLQDYLYDRVTAMKDGVASNAHGRRESYHHRPIPRMSNLYIAPGKDDPARILRELKRGLLVTKMGGGQVNTATGEFVFEVDEGFLVEDGKARHLVRDANLLGVGPETLASIDRLGWDIGWGIGTCGKEGQGVPVSDGQPTMRIPKLLVGGKHE